MDIMRQFLNHLQQSLLQSLQLWRREGQIDNKEHAIAASFTLYILLDLLSAKIIGECVRSETKAADPSLCIFVFGGIWTDACFAFCALEGICLDELCFREEGWVEISEGHDQFLGCVAGGRQTVKYTTPACVLLELLHVDHSINNLFKARLSPNQILISNNKQQSYMINNEK